MPLMMILRIELELNCWDAPHDNIDAIEQWRVGNVTNSHVRGWDTSDTNIIDMGKDLVADITYSKIRAWHVPRSNRCGMDKYLVANINAAMRCRTQERT